jgi:hypothetical protein
MGLVYHCQSGILFLSFWFVFVLHKPIEVIFTYTRKYKVLKNTILL